MVVQRSPAVPPQRIGGHRLLRLLTKPTHTSTVNHYHHYASLPPRQPLRSTTSTTTTLNYHRHVPIPPPRTNTTTTYHYHRHVPLPPPRTTTSTMSPLHNTIYAYGIMFLSPARLSALGLNTVLFAQALFRILPLLTKICAGAVTKYYQRT